MASIVALGLGGCQSASSQDTLGLSLSGADPAFDAALQAAAQETGKSSHLAIAAASAGGRSTQQVAQVDGFVSSRIGWIALETVDDQAVVPAIEAANHANIPVISIGGQPTGEGEPGGGVVISRITSDDSNGAQQAAEYIIRQLGGEGNVLVIGSIPPTPGSALQADGFDAAMSSQPDIKLLRPVAAASRDAARKAVTALLANDVTVDAVFASPDDLALGALDALAAVGKAQSTTVVGFGASPDGLDSILAEGLAGTISRQPALMGRTLIDQVVALRSGRAVPPATAIPELLVTRDNVDRFLP